MITAEPPDQPGHRCRTALCQPARAGAQALGKTGARSAVLTSSKKAALVAAALAWPECDGSIDGLPVD